MATIREDSSRPAVSYRQAAFPAAAGHTQILLIRHGESQPYVPGTPFPLLGGQGDPSLSAEGYSQAERLVERLARAGIDAIYVTPLCRTSQTAAPLARRLGLEPAVEPDLREVHLGEWEGGVYRQMAAENHPIAVAAWKQERWDVIPGAEPAAAFAARVRGAVERLARRHPGQRVAILTHGGVIGQVLAIASGSRPFAFVLADNASISRLLVASERWYVRGFNDTAHLETLEQAVAH